MRKVFQESEFLQTGATLGLLITAGQSVFLCHDRCVVRIAVYLSKGDPGSQPLSNQSALALPGLGSAGVWL